VGVPFQGLQKHNPYVCAPWEPLRDAAGASYPWDPYVWEGFRWVGRVEALTNPGAAEHWDYLGSAAMLGPEIVLSSGRVVRLANGRSMRFRCEVPTQRGSLVYTEHLALPVVDTSLADPDAIYGDVADVGEALALGSSDIALLRVAPDDTTYALAPQYPLPTESPDPVIVDTMWAHPETYRPRDRQSWDAIVVAHLQRPSDRQWQRVIVGMWWRAVSANGSVVLAMSPFMPEAEERCPDEWLERMLTEGCAGSMEPDPYRRTWGPEGASAPGCRFGAFNPYWAIGAPVLVGAKDAGPRLDVVGVVSGWAKVDGLGTFYRVTRIDRWRRWLTETIERWFHPATPGEPPVTPPGGEVEPSWQPPAGSGGAKALLVGIGLVAGTGVGLVVIGDR